MANWPTTIGFKAVDFASVDRTLTDETDSGQVNVRKISAQYYMATIKYNRLTRTEVASIEAFVESLRGAFTAFDIVLPVISDRQGAGGGTPLVNGASQTGTSLVIDGATASVTGWLLAGDLIRLAGHTKVYKVAADVNTDVGGNATITLVQPLMESPANNEAVTITDVPFSMRLTTDFQKYTLSVPNFYQLEVDMREAI